MHHQRPGLLESGSIDGEESFGGNATTDHNDVVIAPHLEFHPKVHIVNSEHENVASEIEKITAAPTERFPVLASWWSPSAIGWQHTHAAIMLDPNGRPTDPERMALRFAYVPECPRRERVTVLEPLLKQALSEHGDRELVADCDVTDAPVLELLNQFGFQPTGTPPYVEHGRTVEWVMGYMDASEAKVDLCRPGDASPE